MVCHGMAWYGIAVSVASWLVAVLYISAEGFAKLACDPWLLLFLVLVYHSYLVA